MMRSIKKLKKYGLSLGSIHKQSVRHERVARDKIFGLITSAERLSIGDAIFGFSDWHGYRPLGQEIQFPYYWFHSSPVVEKAIKNGGSIIEVKTESESIYRLEYIDPKDFAWPEPWGEPSDEVLEKMADDIRAYHRIFKATVR